MSLTRELLTEMELTESAIDRILRAHQEALDAHQAETERIRGEYGAYRLQVDAERVAGQRQATIHDLLRSAGANEAAIPLLAMAISTKEEDWEGGALRDPSAVLAPVCEQYAGFFCLPAPIPTDPITPPLDGSSLTLEDIRCMSPGEINENWSHICAALMQR